MFVAEGRGGEGRGGEGRGGEGKGGAGRGGEGTGEEGRVVIRFVGCACLCRHVCVCVYHKRKTQHKVMFPIASLAIS